MCSGRTTANMPVCRTSTMSKAAKPSSRCIKFAASLVARERLIPVSEFIEAWRIGDS